MIEKIQYVIKNNNDRILASTIVNDDDLIILKYITNLNHIIEHNNIKYRVGTLSNDYGTVYAFSSSKDIIKSSKQIKFSLNILLNLLNELVNFRQNIEQTATKQIQILIHNLISINAHNIQEIYNLIPQDNIANDIPNKKKFVSKVVKTNPDKTALVLLKIMKNNMAIKAEFSVFNKLFESNPKLNMKNHNIHRVLMNIFYSFFPDFTDKNIQVVIANSTLKAYFDYESIHVAFFHLIENATKYIKEQTIFNVYFKDYIDEIEIIFDMVSLKIDEKEKEKIFIEGYSGNYAIETEKKGNGIGMSRVQKIVELNNGKILLETANHNNDKYHQRNKFILKLKKEGYYR